MPLTNGGDTPAMAKVTGSLQKSTEIMKLSNSLIKLPQVSQTMREMSMEMTKVRRLASIFQLLIDRCKGWYIRGDA
jgi:charged multivesicular body protein 3